MSPDKVPGPRATLDAVAEEGVLTVSQPGAGRKPGKFAVDEVEVDGTFAVDDVVAVDDAVVSRVVVLSLWPATVT
jgi:hypothetical protein